MTYPKDLTKDGYGACPPMSTRANMIFSYKGWTISLREEVPGSIYKFTHDACQAIDPKSEVSFQDYDSDCGYCTVCKTDLPEEVDKVLTYIMWVDYGGPE